MGSQSVTDFSATRKKQIQSRVRAFEPAAPDAGRLAGEAGVAAMKSLAPTAEFAQALTSKSVRVAANMISDLVVALKAEAEGTEIRAGGALSVYGVEPSDLQPYSSLAAGLRRKFTEELNASSRKTEAASAAADALSGTVLDVIAAAFPRKKEPSETTREELRRAITMTPEAVVTRMFVKNLLTALLRQTFDAARGRIPREHIDTLMKTLEPRIDNMAIRLTEVVRK
jgi:hypothetical protein